MPGHFGAGAATLEAQAGAPARFSIIPQNRGVKDLTILWSSRALFEHIRAANLNGWQVL